MDSKMVWKLNEGLHCPDRNLTFPCSAEFKNFLVDRNKDYKDVQYSCAKKVFETKQDDFWVMKNMTHLLLDLDVNDHNFDKENRDNDFYNLGLAFGHHLMKHHDCLKEFDEKDQLEFRCPNLYGKILLLKYKNSDNWDKQR